MKPSLLLACLAVAGATACGPPDSERERVLLVTTTTVEDSGLLEALVAGYHGAQSRYRLSTTALGSGAALALGRRGDADLLITHDPPGEARFMEEGHGVEQGPLMRNQFVVAGPPSDPAGVRGMTDLAAALSRIAAARAPFISRGDDSGTHGRERALWGRTGHGESPGTDASWYVEAGSGMAEALRIADQRGAYILTDDGTFRHLSPGLDLESLVEGDPPEVNLYRYTLPARPRHPEGARDLLDWLRGPGQAVIRDHGTARFGEPLFQPHPDNAERSGAVEGAEISADRKEFAAWS